MSDTVTITRPDGTVEVLTVAEFYQRTGAQYCAQCGMHHRPAFKCRRFTDRAIPAGRGGTRAVYSPQGNGVEARFV